MKAFFTDKAETDQKAMVDRLLVSTEKKLVRTAGLKEFSRELIVATANPESKTLLTNLPDPCACPGGPPPAAARG